MRIRNRRGGEPLQPLERVTLVGAEQGTVSVRDSLGREYAHLPAGPEVRFTVAGTLGHHKASLIDPSGRTQETLTFRVDASTRVEDQGGRFAELLQMLYYTMVRDAVRGAIRYRGRLYRFFAPWLRDHVHVLKGMKYFASQLQDGIDLYRDSQRSDGMIWDNVTPRIPPRPGPNHWSVRFDYDGFFQLFDDASGEFHRIPVENDVEYLFVEGLYYTWKATGDDGWMAGSLDVAIKALEYSVSSPYRWSSKYRLLKRGYTIDTWDFMPKGDCILGWGDPMAIDKDRTRFGVMFGDNTGYAAACRYLAEMLEHAGRGEEAGAYRRRAREIKERLDALSWNGRYYTHHVPEEPGLKRDLGVDEASQVSLSNAYSLNRGLTHEQCAAIIRTYQGIRQHLPEGSPGEWYTIYPPFQTGFGDHNSIWQYMNGGVTPIVAGELAHGAFEHGFESYGADILERLLALGHRHGGVFHCTYTGSLPAPPARTFAAVDLAPYASVDTSRQGAEGVPGWTGEGPGDLEALPKGRQELAGVPFLIPDPATSGRRGCIGLSRRPGYARQVELPLGRKAGSIYFLHTVDRPGPDGVSGLITLHYAGGSTFSQYVVDGHNVLPWHHWLDLEAPNPDRHRRTSEVAWRAWDPARLNLQVLAYGLDNPHPDLEIERLSLQAAEGDALWAVLGITLSDEPAYFQASPISFGIPDSWGAAAVVYALIEGLAGAVDAGVAYDRVRLSPRWPSAGVAEAAAVVTYPNSGGYVAHRYRLDTDRQAIQLEITGSGEVCDCHVLLPEGASGVRAVSEGGEDLLCECTQVEGSRYADFAVALPGPRAVRIEYR